MSEKLDLFASLATVSKKKHFWHRDLPAERQKDIAALVAMRWMTGTSDLAQIVRLNETANRHMFDPSMTPTMAFGLLAAGSTGKNSRYNWIKGPARKKGKLITKVVCDYYECSSREAANYKIDAESLLEMAAECGWQPDDVKALTKELDDGSGRTEKAVSKSAGRKRK